MKEQIKINVEESLQTLSYILEISLGNLIEDITILDTDTYFSKNDEFLELSSVFVFKVVVADVDLASISVQLKRLATILNSTLNTYNLTSDGKLVKSSKEDKEGVFYFDEMVYSIKYEIEGENLEVHVNIVTFDV